MKKLIHVSFDEFYKVNEFVAKTSPMRTHYESGNPFEKWVWQTKTVKMQELLNLITYRNVLDIGCGDGKALDLLNPKANYTGIDISPTQLDFFKKEVLPKYKNRPGKISLKQSDAVPLPFPATNFDLVLAWDVLEHVLDPMKLIQDIYRVLKKGGHGLFAIPNERMWEVIRFMALRWPPRSPDHLNIIDLSDVMTVFKKLKKEAFLPIPLKPVHLIHVALVEK